MVVGSGVVAGCRWGVVRISLGCRCTAVGLSSVGVPSGGRCARSRSARHARPRSAIRPAALRWHVRRGSLALPFLSISTTFRNSFAVGRHRSTPSSSPRPAPFWAWCGVRLPPPAPRPSAGLPLPGGSHFRLCSTLGRYPARHRPCIIGNNINGRFWPFSCVLGGCWLGGGRPHHAAASALVSALKLVLAIVVRGLGFGLLLGYFWVSSGFFWVFGFLFIICNALKTTPYR